MDFSLLLPSILDPQPRQRVARQILAILTDYFKHSDMKKFSGLDIGCSSGIITDYLRPHFKSLIGIDIDKHALPHRPGYLYMSASKLKFPDRKFDIVLCNQVYYWLSDAEKMISEIHRVLKPGGVCIFIHVNKYILIEPQYHKPLISFIPRKLALLLEPNYACYYLSYLELLKLCRNFTIHHYTPKILADPRKFHFTRLEKYPAFLLRLIPESLSPNLVWLLEKPTHLPNHLSSSV